MAWQCRIDRVESPMNESVLLVFASFYDDTEPAVILFTTVVRVGPDDTAAGTRAKLVEIGKDARRIITAKAAAVSQWVGTVFSVP